MSRIGKYGPEVDAGGRTVLITGAAQGIGKALAQGFAAHGYRLVLADKQGDRLREVADELGAWGEKPIALEADLSTAQAAHDMVERAVASAGEIHVLINNAGIVQAHHILDIKEEDWDRLFAVNVKGLFFCLQAVARHMVQKGLRGSIINIASTAGKRPRPLMLPYGATKAAVISITRSAAHALAEYGIRVNALCPGIVDTAMWKYLDRELGRLTGKEQGEVFAERMQDIPLGRAQKPEDLVGMALLLASDGAEYVTGQSINVDGGLVSE